jgi:hypothetical protein
LSGVGGIVNIYTATSNSVSLIQTLTSSLVQFGISCSINSLNNGTDFAYLAIKTSDTVEIYSAPSSSSTFSFLTSISSIPGNIVSLSGQNLFVGKFTELEIFSFNPITNTFTSVSTKVKNVVSLSSVFFNEGYVFQAVPSPIEVRVYSENTGGPGNWGLFDTISSPTGPSNISVSANVKPEGNGILSFALGIADLNQVLIYSLPNDPPLLSSFILTRIINLASPPTFFKATVFLGREQIFVGAQGSGNGEVFFFSFENNTIFTIIESEIVRFEPIQSSSFGFSIGGKQFFDLIIGSPSLASSDNGSGYPILLRSRNSLESTNPKVCQTLISSPETRNYFAFAIESTSVSSTTIFPAILITETYGIQVVATSSYNIVSDPDNNQIYVFDQQDTWIFTLAPSVSPSSDYGIRLAGYGNYIAAVGVSSTDQFIDIFENSTFLASISLSPSPIYQIDIFEDTLVYNSSDSIINVYSILTASTTATIDVSPFSILRLSIYSNTIAVTLENSGIRQVSVYNFDGTTWNFVSTITPTIYDSTVSGTFGASIDIFENTLAISSLDRGVGIYKRSTFAQPFSLDRYIGNLGNYLQPGFGGEISLYENFLAVAATGRTLFYFLTQYGASEVIRDSAFSNPSVSIWNRTFLSGIPNVTPGLGNARKYTSFSPLADVTANIIRKGCTNPL